MHGNFTACALMTLELSKEAAALRKQFGSPAGTEPAAAVSIHDRDTMTVTRTAA
jgi:hypothetical protein